MAFDVEGSRGMDVGPILRLELMRSARQPRSYAIKAAVGLGLLATAWLVRESWSYRPILSPMLPALGSPRAMRPLAALLFAELALLQGVAIVLLVPGLVPGSIAAEDRARTLTDLLATPLSSPAIVLGKLAVLLVRAGVVLSVGLPLILPFAIVGVLDPAIVPVVYLILLAWTLFVASVSMLVSVVISRPWLATLTAYAVVVGWLIGPVAYATVASRLPWPLAWLQPLNNLALLGHPADAIRTLWVVVSEPYSVTMTGAWGGSPLVRGYPWFVGFQLALSLLCVSLASCLLRPLRLGSRRGAGRSSTAVRSARPRPPLGDDPMLWKEWYAVSPLGRPVLCWTLLAAGVLVAYPLLSVASQAFLEWYSSWGDLTVGQWHRSQLNESLRHIQENLYFMGLIGVAAIAATSVSGERERGTWTSLATTLVTGPEVVWAKLLGAVVAVRVFAVPLFLIWGLGLATGSAHPVGIMAAAVGIPIYLWYAAAVGVFCSMATRSTERALGTTLLILCVGNVAPLLFVPLNLIRTLTGSWSTVYLAGSTPFMVWASLVSPVDLHEWLAGRVWDSRFSFPGGIGMGRVELHAGLARTYAVSLLVHMIGASLATWGAIRTFETRRGLR